MTNANPTQINRRIAMAGGATALAGLALLSRGAVPAAAGPSIQSGGGVAGGGTVALAEGVTAQFALFASRFVVEDQEEPIITGRIQWVQDDGQTLESTAVTNYGPAPEVDENARLIEGIGVDKDGAEVPFRFMVIDLDAPGSGKDVIQVILGDLENPAFKHDGTVATGDIQLLTFEFE
jgi:hypothetical protein